MATPIEHSVLRCDINVEQMAHVTWKAEAMYKNTQQSHRSMPLRPRSAVSDPQTHFTPSASVPPSNTWG
jgi:hypothetical protein